MAKHKTQDIRNIAICGHGHSGKSTIVDHLLSKTGAVTGTPNVDDGTSICDFDEEEKQHKYSIEASLVHFTHAGKRFNLIDTPGYPDFIGQTIGALHAVETAAVVIDAHSGIQVNTRRVFAEAGKLGLGRLIVISKMGTENIDFPALIDSIRELWGPSCVLLNVPIGCGDDFKGVISTLKSPETAEGALLDPQPIHEALIESIVEIDETVMERYFEGQLPTAEELVDLMVRAVAGGSLIPIVCCSARNDTGIAQLLEALATCALPPGAIERTAEKEGETITIEPKADGPLVAQVFKTRIDPFVQKLSFIRIYSGTLHKDDQVHSTDSRKDIKIGPLLDVMGEATEQIDSVGPGDIVAIAKMEEIHTGTSLGEYSLPKIEFPTPMVGLAVSPKTRGDETKLATALHKMVEEDPTFHVEHDAQTKEMVISGMSELHLGAVQERLQRRDHVEVDTKEPKIPFRETIQIKADGMYRHKKQSGGRGQFGEVHIRMQPLPRNTNIEEFATKANFSSLKSYHYDEEHNFLWVDSVVGGTIPHNFMPAIEKGFKERLARGVIAGYQVQDVCVEVYFGKHHPVDSSEAAFKTAGSMAFRNVFQQAKPALLEPIARLDITVPDDNVGDVYSDLSTRGGRVSGSEAVGGGMQTVKAEVPLREVSTYNRTLSSMTGGQGSYSMEFDHYEVMPANVQQEIISKTKLEEEEED
jgi:elongation factor G